MGFVRVSLLFFFSFLLSFQVQAKVVAITTTTVEQADLQNRVETVGSIESLQSPVVAAELSAKVTAVLVEIGDVVTPQTVLATLDASVYELRLAEAQSELRRIQAQLDLKSLQVQRYTKLLKKKGIDRATYDTALSEKAVMVAQLELAESQVQRAKLKLAQTKIMSPVDGVVDERLISVGSYLVPGTPLFKVVNTQNLRARLPFSERYASVLQVGQKIDLRTASDRGQSLLAEVSYVRPQIEQGNRAIEAFVNFDNQHGWLAGASVQASLVLATYSQSLVVPVQAVVKRPLGDVVYVVTQSDGEVSIEERPVEVGLISEQGAQIVSGLQEGETVAVDGARFLSAGAKVEVQP